MNVSIYPNGDRDENKEFMSVYLNNDSPHDVTVNYRISIGYLKSASKNSSLILSKSGRGFSQFVKISAIGIFALNVTVKAEVTILKEEILNGIGVVSLGDWQFMEQKIEQKMEQKLEQKLEQKMEQKMEQKLDQKLNQLDQKINSKF